MNIKRRKTILLFSHVLNLNQEIELKERWRVNEIVYLPPELQTIWSDVPPHLETISTYLKPIWDWISSVGVSGDVAVIQGDFGAVYLAVRKVLEIGIIPLYATTQRVVKETQRTDGTVKQERVFSHVRFRIYGE